MSTKYNSLEELRKKKDLLKNEISEIENLITFENTKESLSVFTHGFTDRYLTEEVSSDGEKKVAINTGEIIKEISSSVKDNVLSRNSVYNFAKSDAGLNVIEDTLKIATVTLVGSYAKKNFYNSNLKKKLIGVALIYLAPIALRYLRKRLEEYQRNQTAASLEKLI